MGDTGKVEEERDTVLRRALRLEFVTVGWNVVEGLVAVAAASAAGSVALLGFGLDSFVESASGLVLVWRLRAERQGRKDIERLERRAQRLVSFTLFLLAAYVGLDSLRALWNAEKSTSSPVGLALVSLSLFLMWWLAGAKLKVARKLQCPALKSDAFQTHACWWLSLVTLAGIGLNATLGWWWADPLAALGVVALLVREAIEAWRGESCC